MHLKGEGGPQDFAQARRLIGQAAAQGHADAQFILGRIHIKGEGVSGGCPQDLEEARRLISLAAAQGHEGAHRALVEMSNESAAALLAEEDAASSAASKPSKKKKSKASRTLPAADASSSSSGALDVSAPENAGEDAERGRARAAADVALCTAVESGELSVIAAAIETHCGSATDSVLTRARAARDRLKEKRKKESQRQRKAHGVMMKEARTSDLQATAVPPASTLAAALDVSVEEAAVDTPMIGGLFVPGIELVQSLTDGFSDELSIGVGGCAVVYRAISPAGRALAIKRATYADQSALSELDAEVALLRRCDHPHLLPLLGYCRDPEALCLIFPLMTGGSLEHRLFLSESHIESLRKLGHFTSSPKVLTWRQRLRVLHEASLGLLYLHGLDCVHRDFKPANVLLRSDLTAVLADTGFAKAAQSGALENTKHASITSRGVCHTAGYADRLITSGGGFSSKTDAYAVGVTLLVCITGRPAVRGNDDIFDAIEEDHEQIFGEIDPAVIADPSVWWPAPVCRELVPLVLATEKTSSLCNPKKFKRLPLADAVDAIARLQSAPVEAAEATSEAAGTALEAAAGALHISEVSTLVRDIGRKATGDDEQMELERRLQDRASSGFKSMMARLDRLHAEHTAEAPTGFEDRINFWRSRGQITPALRGLLHELRRWRNAAEHDDRHRWRAEGPKDEDALTKLLRECDAVVTSMEKW